MRSHLKLAVVAVGAVALLAGPSFAAPTSTASRKATIDRKLAVVEKRARDARGRSVVLSQDVARLTNRLRSVEARLAPLMRESESARAAAGLRRAALDDVARRLRDERLLLAQVRGAIGRQRSALGVRLRNLYMRGQPDPLVSLLTGAALTDAEAARLTLERVASRDRELIVSVTTYERRVKVREGRIAALRAQAAVRAREALDAYRVARSATVALDRQRGELARSRGARSRLLARVSNDRREAEVEAVGLRAQSAALASVIVRAQGGTVTPVGNPSAAGFVWPVSGTITSRFGPRWGRMHEGLDIAAPSGTPVAAAAAGRVIVAGWSGGYGYLVVIDHGNGLATAYAHQQSVATTVGAEVSAGTVVGYVGSTGNSTGPHLHFEVRVGGGVRDPLTYL